MKARWEVFGAIMVAGEMIGGTDVVDKMGGGGLNVGYDCGETKKQLWMGPSEAMSKKDRWGPKDKREEIYGKERGSVNENIERVKGE